MLVSSSKLHRILAGTSSSLFLGHSSTIGGGGGGRTAIGGGGWTAIGSAGSVAASVVGWRSKDRPSGGGHGIVKHFIHHVVVIVVSSILGTIVVGVSLAWTLGGTTGLLVVGFATTLIGCWIATEDLVEEPEHESVRDTKLDTFLLDIFECVDKPRVWNPCHPTERFVDGIELVMDRLLGASLAADKDIKDGVPIVKESSVDILPGSRYCIS